MSIEEPAYRVVQKQGNFEVRDYPALVVAEVNVGGDQQHSTHEGFRYLAGYIFGRNQRGQRIAMTAPVLQTEDIHGWLIRFVLPRIHSLATLPLPLNKHIHLTDLPAARFAAVRFSGRVLQRVIVQQTQALTDFIATQGLYVGGLASVAQYSPPWTPWFLRRNEVLLPLEN